MSLTDYSQGCRLFSFMYISRVFGCSCFLILKKQKASTIYRLSMLFPVGVTGFEPATTRPPDAYSNRAELHPELRMQRYAFIWNLQTSFSFYLRKY